MTTKTLYSADDELYQHESIEDAITDLYDCLSKRDLEECDEFTVWSCEFKEVTVSYFVPDILEAISERMYEELGEHADCDVDLCHKEIVEFEQMLADYLNSKDTRTFHISVGRSAEITLTKQDILDVVEEDAPETENKTVWGVLQY